MGHRAGNATVACTVIGAVLIAIQQNTHLLPGSRGAFALDRERCFGVVRAGKNDCGTATHACAGQARRDAAGTEWLMLPAGTCVKISGGELKPVAS